MQLNISGALNALLMHQECEIVSTRLDLTLTLQTVKQLVITMFLGGINGINQLHHL